MLNIIKNIDVNGKINTTELFTILKTKSQKSNVEIFSKIQNFNKFPEFFNYYLNKDSVKYFNCLHQFIHGFSNIDITSSSFETTIEQYISYSTKIILSINLLLKIHEILNKILISSKKKLNSLKIKNQIENTNQENFFNLVDIFSNISRPDFRCNSSTSTAISSMSSSDFTQHNSSFKNYSSEKEIKKFEANVEVYKEPSSETPRFEKELNSSIDESIENLNENNKIYISDSVLTLSQYVFVDEKNNNVNVKIKDKEKDSNKYENLLIMINNLYKKELINDEGKIKLKKMVISKSIKVEKFYYDIYQSPNKDKEKLIEEIKKLME